MLIDTQIFCAVNRHFTHQYPKVESDSGEGEGGGHVLVSLGLLDPYIVMNALLILGESS